MESNATKTEFSARREPGSKPMRWWAVAINLWISVVIALFLLLRIVDSNTAHRIFHSLGHSLGHSLAAR